MEIAVISATLFPTTYRNQFSKQDSIKNIENQVHFFKVNTFFVFLFYSFTILNFRKLQFEND